jgi:ubiquinone/menaquinone biosynthesis C-methylase UbiE
MVLSQREFNVMNSPLRRFLQCKVEIPILKSMGLSAENQDLFEIGCGSGYGALLLSELNPKSYEGIDLMPKQIQLAVELAQKHHLDGYIFRVQDATDLSDIADCSKDVVVILGILHHIPGWRVVLQECLRVLRNEGMLFVEEPNGKMIEQFDRVFHWGHPENVKFSLRDLEAQLQQYGFKLHKRLNLIVFGAYAAQKLGE